MILHIQECDALKAGHLELSLQLLHCLMPVAQCVQAVPDSLVVPFKAMAGCHILIGLMLKPIGCDFVNMPVFCRTTVGMCIVHMIWQAKTADVPNVKLDPWTMRKLFRKLVATYGSRICTIFIAHLILHTYTNTLVVAVAVPPPPPPLRFPLPLCLSQLFQ